MSGTAFSHLSYIYFTLTTQGKGKGKGKVRFQSNYYVEKPLIKTVWNDLLTSFLPLSGDTGQGQ